jgi:hypothetical protein
MPPVITVVRFHREHNMYKNQQPPGTLHNTRGAESLGFLRGKDLSVGDRVDVFTRSGNHTWSGSITESVDDNFTGPPNNEGPAWFFSVVVTKYDPDPAQQDNNISTTVTSSSGGGTSPTLPADPQPQDVP